MTQLLVWGGAAGAGAAIALAVRRARGRLMPHGLLSLAPVIAAGVYTCTCSGPPRRPDEVIARYYECLWAGDIEGAKALMVERDRRMVDVVAPLLGVAGKAGGRRPPIKKLEILDLRIEGDRASAKVRLATEGRVRVETLRLRLVDGRWLVGR